MIISKTNKSPRKIEEQPCVRLSRTQAPNCETGAPRNRSSSSQPRYMQATTSSFNRAKKGLTLREKIFELHDAVRVLQTNEVSQRRQLSQNRQATPEQTETSQVVTTKIEAVESQCQVLRQAIGTMADAVADEIDDLKKEFTAELDLKLTLVSNRVENAQLSAEKAENQNAKL